MKVFFFTFVFERYQELVMVQPFTFRNNYQLGHRFFNCFFTKYLKNTEISNCCIDQVRVDFQQNEIQV